MSKENHQLDDDNSTINNDTADFSSIEDHDQEASSAEVYDTLEDAMDALADDEEPTEEQTDSSNDEKNTDEDLDEGDDVLVALSDGEEVNLGELKKSYFRSKDYTHKTEALAKERKAVEALRKNYSQNAEVLQMAYHNLTETLEGLIPQEPSLALAQSDPAAYQYQQALRNNAIAELQKVYAGSQEVTSAIQGASEEEIARYKSDEDAKLIAALPMLKEPGRKATFDDAIKKTALEFGFNEQEINSTIDHRIFQLVHYARLGKIAERNRENAGRRISEKPRKGNRSNPIVGKPSRNREAMRRLDKTGSIEDAMAVDFD